MERDHDWRDQALCAQIDPDLFYPENGAIPHAARRICAQCPVSLDCLVDALVRRDVSHGIRGGKTPAERRKLLRRSAEREGVGI
jgi:WhiB family transcriptional regulator, redox-sensing transcriptional regulator